MAANVTLRNIESSDINRLAAIGVAILPQDPFYTYRFLYAKDYPEEVLRWWELYLHEWLPVISQGIYRGVVAEVPCKDNSEKREIVRFAIWEHINEQAPKAEGQSDAVKSPSEEVEERFPHTRARAEAVHKVAAEVNSAWSTALVSWGIEEASKADVPIVVLVTELGKKLYEKLGFKLNGINRVQVPGEEEFYDMQNMGYVPEAKE